VEPADLVQTSLGLLLAGDIARSISTEDVLRSVLATIRNLSRNVRRHDRFADTDSRVLDRVADPLDTSEVAFQALLDTDIRTALAELPAERRRAVMACLLEGNRAVEYASVRGIAASTVRNHLLRGRSQLRGALAAYRPGVRDQDAGDSLPATPGE
jgi:DNA-directed RNA polymerase specialized sigma24 family protein